MYIKFYLNIIVVFRNLGRCAINWKVSTFPQDRIEISVQAKIFAHTYRMRNNIHAWETQAPMCRVGKYIKII